MSGKFDITRFLTVVNLIIIGLIIIVQFKYNTKPDKSMDLKQNRSLVSLYRNKRGIILRRMRDWKKTQQDLQKKIREIKKFNEHLTEEIYTALNKLIAIINQSETVAKLVYQLTLDFYGQPIPKKFGLKYYSDGKTWQFLVDDTIEKIVHIVVDRSRERRKDEKFEKFTNNSKKFASFVSYIPTKIGAKVFGKMIKLAIELPAESMQHANKVKREKEHVAAKKLDLTDSPIELPTTEINRHLEIVDVDLNPYLG